MTEFVCRRTGRTYRTGAQLDQHGQASVHAVEPATSNLALKRYLPDTLRDRPELEARTKAMIANPPAYRPGRSDHPSCAWPEDAAYLLSDRFVGFVMPRVDTRDAHTVHDVATAHQTTWRDRVIIAENLTRVVALLHDHDVVIGDFREPNLLIWNDHRVTLLGCDRMQIVDSSSGRTFPCLSRRDGPTAPELLHPALPNTLRASNSDIFPLAVQLHLLLLGRHPFCGDWTPSGPTPHEHVLSQNGLWSYAGDPRLIPPADAAPLAVLPQALQRCFRAAFVDGARNPQTRPPASEWLTELIRLRESLVTCAREPSHVYGDHLSGCPWCPQDARSPTPAQRFVPPGYTHLRASPRSPASATATPGATPTLPARPGPTATTTAATPTRSSVPRPTHPAAVAPTARPRHRRRRRAAAWAAATVVGIGAAIGIGGTLDRSAPPTTGPTSAASTQASSPSPSPTPRPDDPTQALEQIRAEDATTVETLAESWVAQLAARPAGTPNRDSTATDAAVLAGHDSLRKQYPGAVLLWSPDWNYNGRFWITVLAERFTTAEEANAWCDVHGFAPRECFAKKLSHSAPVEGSAKYRG
jgi:hypothetical protein